MEKQTTKGKEEKKEVKLLSPKLDVIFQALFGEEGAERITKGFLESILKEKIEKIDLSKNPILRREFKDHKLGVLDILAEINNQEKVNIELQISNMDNIIERILYYWSRLYSRQMKKGENYKELSKTVVILITNFEIKEIKEIEELDYYTKWQIMEINNRIILTEKLEIYIIELPKIIGKEQKEDKLLDWLYFIDNPKSERVARSMEENEDIKEAVEKLNRISEDEKMQRIADLREKAILDEKAIYSKGRNDGKEEGIKEIAKNLLKKGMAKEEVAEITKLEMEEIVKLL